MKCKNCESEDTYLFGIIRKDGHETQSWDCFNCHKKTIVEVVQMVKLFNRETLEFEEVDEYHAFDVLGYFPDEYDEVD